MKISKNIDKPKMGPKSRKNGLLRHQQRNPKRQIPKIVKTMQLKINNEGLDYSRNCAQKSYRKQKIDVLNFTRNCWLCA